MSDCEPRNFLQPCLLLLLDRPDHGYDLARRLEPVLGLTGVDAAQVYRALRGLEQQGLVASRWAHSPSGPARRVYDLTEAGLRYLDTRAALLAEVDTVISRFLKRYRTVRHLTCSAFAEAPRTVTQ